MRDYRDAETMAHAARAFLSDQGLKITSRQSLELIAKALGATDWNTLAAAIRVEATPPRSETVRPQAAVDWGPRFPSPRYSTELALTLQRALGYGDARKHQYTTLEHLLLALTDDADAAEVMRACGVDLAVLQSSLIHYIDEELPAIVVGSGTARGGSRPTPAFERVMQRAVLHAERMRQQEVTGGNLVVVLFAERLSPAVQRLNGQSMTAEDASNFVKHGIVKRSVTIMS